MNLSTNLRILAFGNVNERFASRMDHINRLENGGAVVGNGGLAAFDDDELVHSARSQRGSNGIGHQLAGVNVADDMLPTAVEVVAAGKCHHDRGCVGLFLFRFRFISSSD